MLKPDISEFVSWDGNRTPRDRRQHPIPSNLASELRLAAGDHQNHFAFEHAQLQPFERTCSSGVSSDSELQILRHHAQSFTPTTDLNPSGLSTLSTPSSISVHLPSEQPELPQDHDEVILQDIPPYNRSMCAPEASPSRTINCENKPRIINGSSKNAVPAKEHPEVIDLTFSDENVEEPILITIRDSSPSDWMEPLFTPPPTKRRARVFMDHVAVPSLPKGTTKAGYEPMSASPTPPTHPPRDVSRASICDAPEFVFNGNNASPSGKGKGKERADPPISISSPASALRKKRKRVPAYLGEGVDTRGSAIIDAFCTHTLLPLANPNEESPPHWKAMITDARFTFTKQSDKHMPAPTLDAVELVAKHHLQRPEGIPADSQDVYAHITSMDSDCMSLQERPAWELTPSCASPKVTPGDGNRQIEQTQPTSNSTLHHRDTLESCSSKPSVAPPPDHPIAISSAPPDKGVAFGIDEDVDLNLYFNGLGDSPNKQVPAPCEDTFGPPSPGPLRFNEQHMGLSSFGGDGFLGVPLSPSCGDSGQLPASVSPSVFLTGHEDTPLESHSSSQWTPGNDIDSPSLGDVLISQEPGTIDPSLLRGAATSGESTSRRKHQPQLSLPEPIVYVRRPQDVSGMRSGKKPVQIKFREQESPEGTDHHIEGITAVVPPDSMTDGQSHSDEAQDDSDWVPSGSRVPSASKHNTKPRVSRPSISVVQSNLESSHLPSAAGNVSSISLKSSGDRIRIRLKGPRPPEGIANGSPNTAEKTFCHHCRNTTNRLKMRCSNDIGGGQTCGKRFCQRCIEKRYPDITFDRFSCSFLCPFCTNTCNCSTCSRKRGEDYVSMRTASFTGPRIQPNVTVVRDRASAKPVSGSASATAISEPSAESVPDFWAHVYGLEGQHLGVAYRKEPSPIPKPLEKRAPRVFIGRPLSSWRVRSVRDLEALPDKVTTFMENLEKQGKGKGKAVEFPPRLFIGNRAALHEPFGPMFSALSPASSRSPSPEPGSENRLLQVPEMEGYWPQPDVGESCVWRPPPLLGLERGLSLPLSDEQVAAAIQVALATLS